MAEPSWLEQAREMRAETPRRSRREIAVALGVRIQDVDYWLARERKQAKPKRTLERKAKPRITRELERRMARFKRGDRHLRCRNPECEHPDCETDAHHAVYKQHVIAEHGDEWDPWDAVNICWHCHKRHHDPLDPWRLPMRALRQNNIDFAVILFGAYRAYTYFNRYYSGDDPRVEKLTEKEAA